MDKVLFVCSGNTCRSPFAEKYFNKLAKELSLSSFASSAGLFTYGGESPSKNAITASADFGVDGEMSAHASHAITAEMLAKSDFIIAMGPPHLEVIEKAIHSSLCVKDGQRRLLLGSGISDPYGGSVSDYKSCYLQIANEIRAFIEANYK